MAHGVEITGIGVCSAAGVGYPALIDGIQRGTDLSSPFDTALPVERVASVPGTIRQDPDFPDDRKAWLAFTALEEALVDAGGLEAIVDRPERCAVFLGTGLSSVTAQELEVDIYPHLNEEGRFDRRAMARDMASDRAAPRRHMPARVTDEICRRLGVRGPRGTSFSACSAAAQAIAEGLWAIRRGEVDVALVGGHDSMIHPMGLLSFVVLGALAESRCRPFDVRRNGFMIGEAAALLVLESTAHAQSRRARSRGRVLGAGTSADAWNATAPHPDGEGAARAMTRALRDAGLDPSQIDHINAHGTGTPLGDVAEARAIHAVFGGDTPVSSVKGCLGHTIAAAGALEAVVSVASLEHGFLPGTLGLDEPDKACPIATIQEPRAQAPRRVLSNSFGFGGQNCSLLFATAHA